MDKIIIQDKIKGKVEMEVVMTFRFKDSNYVIYKDIEEYYIAKYNETDDCLDTCLTEDELLYAENVLKEVLNNVKG